MSDIDITSFLSELDTLESKESNATPSDNTFYFSSAHNVRALITTSTTLLPELSLQQCVKGTPFNISSNIPTQSVFAQVPDLFDELREQHTTLRLNEDVKNEQRSWPRFLDTNSLPFRSLIVVEQSSPTADIELGVDQVNHQLSMTEYKEVPINSRLNASNSTSLLRAWNEKAADFHRGDAQAFPFLPGGIEAKPSSAIHTQTIGEKIDWVSFWSAPATLLTKAPGLSRGLPTIDDQSMRQSTEHSYFDQEEEEEEEEEIEEEDDEDEEEDVDAEEEEEAAVTVAPTLTTSSDLSEVEKLIDTTTPATSATQTEAASATTAATSGDRPPEKKVWAFNDTKEITTPFAELISNPAIVYPFELDSFQKQAIYHMEKGESVFISAHTSAGKTVIAEYAIAMAAKNMTRAIYTSPIKALSNQKFRDFKNTFNNVGLITGDVSVNPTASCLVLTTEILRSMLYKGADLIRDIEWVIFDEVHYLNDLERGVVWEEVIIMLPAHIKIVLLSATVSNPLEFADWIGRTKKMPIYVIGTTKRPVPLEHFINTPSNEMFKIVDSSRRFLMDGYNAAYASMNKESSSSGGRGGRGGAGARGGRGGGGGGGGGRSGGGGNSNKSSNWTRLITTLNEKNQLPVIVFSFSKAKCQEYAFGLGDKVVLTNNTERSIIKVFIQESLSRLSADDRELPQILQIRDFLERGIGVHHGGLLPIVKELVEILFSKSLVKVLFATETFAMGVNMPAKTVVYSHTRKHDGLSFRELLPGEYTQMSGRAGRRGLDSVGTVLLACWKELPESSTLESMILGVPSKLNSQFRLTYNMILNLLRVQDFKVEDMIKRSFSEFSSQKDLPEIRQEIEKIKKQYDEVPEVECILGEPDIENYYQLFCESKSKNQAVQKAILSVQSDNHFQAGRVVILCESDDMKYHNYTIGVILQCNTTSTKNYINTTVARSFSIFALRLKGADEGRNVTCDGHYIYISANGLDIRRVCQERIKIDVRAIETDDKASCSVLEQQLLRLLEQHPLPLGPPALDPIGKMKLKNVEFVETYRGLEKIEELIPQSKCHKCPKLAEHYNLTERRTQLKQQLSQHTFSTSDENLRLMPEFQTRLKILQTLGYIDQDNNVLVKGKVSREINTCEELIIPELIFENAFLNLDPAEIVAVLSTLIFQEKDAKEPSLTPRLLEAKRNLQELTNRLTLIQLEHHLDVPSQDDERSRLLNFGLMEVCYEWARGMPFHEICQLTNVLEGSIVRAITRIGETCQEVRNSARIIGDTKLFQKMEEAAKLIKRDIVFASSLYIV
ncbi:hypothetical protein SAMD00019534_103580 [Acytostelium subglobosum LB1]|uniref:hypothetical protein n=1 Tax=Acytostelium subglobosum LB1 TaxID=1410327 RepID=UPI0006451F99|nr:hypothetical protein SAMD00019534_103580 [Acytostelium subglobosum LB1]GAM27183.1 hypothetical protein SAMD00019534_103580 [Acytostelium subglobosum LB1]|eukprot:XP_012750063.1 hypothetical protein SAMD00019534_103580 [Acytostelium subglobosum LB1]